MSNAAKYTPESGVITVEQFYDAENKLWGFSVNNPGDVIPEEKLSHLFERFYEGEYRRFHTNGTGIGLSLTKDLVMLHHGKIEVSSTAEQGNTFSITVPVDKEAFAEDEIDEAISSKDILELQAEETGKSESVLFRRRMMERRVRKSQFYYWWKIMMNYVISWREDYLIIFLS